MPQANIPNAKAYEKAVILAEDKAECYARCNNRTKWTFLEYNIATQEMDRFRGVPPVIKGELCASSR